MEHCTFTALSAQKHCTFTALSAQKHCIFTALSAQKHCIFTALSAQKHCTFTALSAQHHCVIKTDSNGSSSLLIWLLRKFNFLSPLVDWGDPDVDGVIIFRWIFIN
jgi:hypothetical protein